MALSLDEFLDRQEIEGFEPNEEQQERFKIASTDAADWAFRKLKGFEAERDAHRETARVHRERIDAWLDDVSTPLEHDIEFFEGLLKEWAASLVEPEFEELNDWRKVHKTHSTPNGKVSARQSVDGKFTTSEEGRKHAAAVIVALGRYELLAWGVAATPLDKAREAGTVDLNDRDEYRVLNKDTGEWLLLPGVYREGRGQITYTVST